MAFLIDAQPKGQVPAERVNKYHKFEILANAGLPQTFHRWSDDTYTAGMYYPQLSYVNNSVQTGTSTWQTDSQAMSSMISNLQANFGTEASVFSASEARKYAVPSWFRGYRNIKSMEVGCNPAATISGPDFTTGWTPTNTRLMRDTIRVDKDTYIVIDHTNSDGIYARAFTYDGNGTYTLGTEVKIATLTSSLSWSDYANNRLQKIGASKFACIYQEHNGVNWDLKGVIIDLSGTTITAGTPQTINAGMSTNTSALSLAKYDTDKFLAGYYNPADQFLYARVITVVGTTMTINSQVAIHNASTASSNDFLLAVTGNTNRVVCHYARSANEYYRTIDVSGTSFTANAEQNKSDKGNYYGSRYAYNDAGQHWLVSNAGNTTTYLSMYHDSGSGATLTITELGFTTNSSHYLKGGVIYDEVNDQVVFGYVPTTGAGTYHKYDYTSSSFTLDASFSSGTPTDSYSLLYFGNEFITATGVDIEGSVASIIGAYTDASYSLQFNGETIINGSFSWDFTSVKHTLDYDEALEYFFTLTNTTTGPRSISPGGIIVETI